MRHLLSHLSQNYHSDFLIFDFLIFGVFFASFSIHIIMYVNYFSATFHEIHTYLVCER